MAALFALQVHDSDFLHAVMKLQDKLELDHQSIL